MRHTVALLCSLAALDPVSASVLSTGHQLVPSLRRNDLRALRFRGGATCSTPNVPARNPSLHASLPAVEIPTELRLLLGSAGIFLSFSVFAVLQEDVYKKSYGGEFFASTFFALLIERGINALVAFVGVAALGKSGLRIPHVDIFKSGISQMLAMAASNEALRYVSYPTQVLGKSCKMVPVMAGGIVLGGKRYSAVEYAQVLAITLGVCIFNFGGGKKKVGKKDSPYGLFLIVISLLMDAFTGGLQDKIKASTKALNPDAVGPKRPSMHESMLWTNLSGCIVAFFLALLSGHLVGGVKFCMKNPQVLTAILVYSISSAVGQNFVYYTLTQFNPLVLTTVTTTRNPQNSLNGMQWSGCSLVFAGLMGDILRKLNSSPKKPVAAAPPPPPAADSTAQPKAQEETGPSTAQA